MAYLSILQVASSDRAVRDRVASRVEQLAGAPARLAREVGLVLHRGRASLTHGAGASEGPLQGDAGVARLEQVVALEASRSAPTAHRDDGVSVITIVALGPAPLTPALPIGDEAALVLALQSLGAATDAAVERLTIHVAPEQDDRSFDAGAVGEGYPHLVALRASLAAAQQVSCRFCGSAFEAYRTTCPSCGGAVER